MYTKKDRTHKWDLKMVTFHRSYKISKTRALILKGVCRPNIFLLSTDLTDSGTNHAAMLYPNVMKWHLSQGRP